MTTLNSEPLVLLLHVLYERNYKFTTVTPTTHHLINQRIGNEWSNDIYDIFGWNRPFKIDITGPELFELMKAAAILRPVGNGWQSTIRVSSAGSILFAHSGFPTDANDAVFFGPDSYRFVSEIYHSLPKMQTPIKRCVDVGSGSGVGAILLASSLPQSEVWGVDINHQALFLASVNAQACAITNVNFKYSDLLTDLDGKFDLIIANPPYLVDTSKRVYRHGKGALGAQLSLDIVDAAIARLSSGGALLLYTGVAVINGHDQFLEEVKLKIKAAGFSYDYTEIDPDIFGEELASELYSRVDRIAAVRLLMYRPLLENPPA